MNYDYSDRRLYTAHTKWYCHGVLTSTPECALHRIELTQMEYNNRDDGVAKIVHDIHYSSFE
jgi:hypothetical protein